jgi:hypothetical protein
MAAVKGCLCGQAVDCLAPFGLTMSLLLSNKAYPLSQKQICSICLNAWEQPIHQKFAAMVSDS